MYLPPTLICVVLKARHLHVHAWFCLLPILGLPEHIGNWMDGYPLGLGLVAEDKPTEFLCMYSVYCTCDGL